MGRFVPCKKGPKYGVQKNRVVVIQKKKKQPSLFSFWITTTLFFCNPYFGPFFTGHKPTHVFKTRIVGEGWLGNSLETKKYIYMEKSNANMKWFNCWNCFWNHLLNIWTALFKMKEDLGMGASRIYHLFVITIWIEGCHPYQFKATILMNKVTETIRSNMHHCLI